MTLTANSSGVIVGKFSTPAVNPASKKLTFTGGSGSVAEAVFFADGVFGEVKKNGRITTADVLSPPIIDANSAVPIFQVFQTPIDADISSVGLHFSAIGATFVSVQIREMDGDYPSRLFVRAAVVKDSLITANSWHDFVFDAPVLLSAGKKYALCVFCSDVATELSVANIGAALSSTATATNTSHFIGELYTSANGVDYQHQKNKVLAFRVKKPTYSEAVKTIDLGVVAVTNINRICVLSPSSQTLSGLSADRVLLTLPDSTIIHALDGQVISLATTVTGNIAVSKRIYSNSNRSSVAVGGTQILVGRVGTSGDYISAPIISEVGGSLRVCIEANAPIGSDVAVFVSDASVVSWTPASLVGSPIDLGNGTSRFVFVSSALSTTRSIYKIHLAGTTELVPVVYSSSVESGVFIAASDALVAHNSNVTAHGLDALRLRLIANGIDADLLSTNHITDINNAFSVPSGSFNAGTTGTKPYTDGVCETRKLGTIYFQLAQDAVTGEFSTRVFNVSWSAWRYHASKAGDSLQVFSAADGASGKQVVNFDQLGTKAAKAGDSLQVFSAADGSSGKQVVNFSQLDTKAAKAGDAAQVFSAADGSSGKQVVNFSQLDTKAAKAGDGAQVFSVAAASSGAHAVNLTTLIGIVYPIGSVYISKTDNRNPNIILGVGVWSAVDGKALFGYKSGDADFGAAGGTGGNKNLSLTMTVESRTSSSGGQAAPITEAITANNTFSGYMNTGDRAIADDIDLRFKLSQEKILPPYDTFYIWERTA
ncbi:phage baseplate protein [Polynucleobacter sp.]|uniref:phage baseplate protein n=1 Tax=Polynucleobacter sp. TaxID=2029855 RepID=UPI003F69C2D8